MLTALLTVLSGTIVFIMGQVVVEFLIKPYLEVRKAVADICYVLHYWAPEICNPQSAGTDADEKEAVARLRNVAAAYYSKTVQLPCYWIFRMFRRVPSRMNALEAYRCLNYLSAAMRQSTKDYQCIHDRYERAHRILGIAMLTDRTS
ncbi:MAG: hypothetical protein AAB152_06475 [Candidatus Coatesbacteria bacterium]